MRPRWLLFEVGDLACALPATDVREVHDAFEPVPLPGTAPWFLGTVTLRGRVLPVTSLPAWLGRAALGERVGPLERGAHGAIGVELDVDGHGYLLAVGAARPVLESEADAAGQGSGDGSGEAGAGSDDTALASVAALNARGLRAVARRFGGRSAACFRAADLVASAAFIDIVGTRAQRQTSYA